METKTSFGRVYVLQRETTKNNVKEEIVQQKLLENVFFSTVDHKWYNSDGNLSPLYETYKGTSYSVQFIINQQDKVGKEVKFQAKLNLPYKLGEVGHQDFEGVPSDMQAMTKRWESLGILSGDVENDVGYQVLRDLQGAALTASICPGWKVSQMKAFRTAMDPFFILDDYIDKGKSKNDMPFQLSQSFWTKITEILEGKKIIVQTSNMPKQYEILIRGMQELRNVIQKKEELGKNVIQTFKEFHNALILENCREWKQTQRVKTSRMFKSTQKEIREVAVGARVTLELVLFDQGLRIDDKIRDSFLFRSILKAYSKQCTFVNDLMSLKKEMVDQGNSNEIYLSHVKDGLPLEEAFQKAVNKINMWTQVINEIGEFLIHLYGEYEETEKMVNVIKNIVAGNIQWHGFAKRYHPDMIYDCVIELE